VTRAYDYVIVGGGTAGCILASRLTEDAETTVCVIEAGRDPAGDERVADYRVWGSLVGGDDDFSYAVEPQQRGNSGVAISAARILGGSSSHNTVLAFRPPDVDLRRWEAAGATGWGPEDCRPYLERVIERVHIAEVPHSHPLPQAFIGAARTLGYGLVDLGSPDFGEGVGWLHINVRDGRRQSASVAYLDAVVRERPNLTIVTNTLVSAIAIEDGRAVGVRLAGGEVAARREVLLCAGAVGSPKLLLLSGVGPAGHLQDVGIPVRADVPGVGENLQDHAEGIVVFEARKPIPEPETHGWDASLFVRSDPALDAPDIQMHFGAEAYDLFTLAAGYPTPQHAFSITPNVARPHSRGTVRLRSTDPHDPPRVDPRYLNDHAGADAGAMLFGMRLARKLAAQDAFAEWAGSEVAPGRDVTSDDALLEFLRAAHGSVFHPAGTCKAGGASDPLAVVDPELRVRGIESLRVVDASILPTLVGVNPCITCMTVAERAADLIAGPPSSHQ
jgi:choline dehydrogenase